MGWLSLIIALLKAIDSLSDYLAQKKLIDAATANLLKEQMGVSRELVDKALAARKTAADKHASTGGVLDESDPNLRD